MDAPLHRRSTRGPLFTRDNEVAHQLWTLTGRTRNAETKLKEKDKRPYRLPTEAEMEYATRAGALTSRYFGETDDLLPKYARYQDNSRDRTWPVGNLKPNDLGLFDVQGNVYAWCQERYKAYPTVKGEEVTEDREDRRLDISTDSRMLRGSSFGYPPSRVRSAFRNSNAPEYRSSYYGFRPARTLTP